MSGAAGLGEVRDLHSEQRQSFALLSLARSRTPAFSGDFMFDTWRHVISQGAVVAVLGASIVLLIRSRLTASS